MTRISETPPAMCSGCFGQYPERVHVDLESSWDGPVIEGGTTDADGNVVSRIPVSIDELILCEDCVLEAAKLLGMSKEGEDTVRMLREELADTKARLRGMEDYASKMEAAVAAKPKARKPAR